MIDTLLKALNVGITKWRWESVGVNVQSSLAAVKKLREMGYHVDINLVGMMIEFSFQV